MAGQPPFPRFPMRAADRIIDLALEEDVGLGDITTAATVEPALDDARRRARRERFAAAVARVRAAARSSDRPGGGVR